MRIHARDHKLRELALEARTLEVNFGGFVLSQSRPGADEARRLALEVSYGQAARELQIAGHGARVYELGPEPPPDDIDGRMPSVVTWHDAEMFYLIASGEMAAERLVQIAQSMYLVPTGVATCLIELPEDAATRLAGQGPLRSPGTRPTLVLCRCRVV